MILMLAQAEAAHGLPWIGDVAQSCAVLVAVWFFLQHISKSGKQVELMEQRSSAAHLEAARMCKETQLEGHAVMLKCMAAIGESQSTLARACTLIERLEQEARSR